MHNENLWAPWRMAYLRDLERRAGALGQKADEPASFLSDYWSDPARDEANHVVHRDEHGMILLNRYPYAAGHLLVAIGEARPSLLDYDATQRAAFWQLVETAMDLLQRTLRPQGVNLGVNQGRAAGAGVPGHLHAHLVPRWNGDTNFMTVVGVVRVIPDSLEEMARQFREAVGS